ncbi:hypothetical protein THAOC_27587, partial [Thalassiosira oceanica]
MSTGMMRLVHQEPKASWNNSNSPRGLSDPALTDSPSSMLQGGESASDEATPLTTEAATGDGGPGEGRYADGEDRRRTARPEEEDASDGPLGRFCPRSRPMPKERRDRAKTVPVRPTGREESDVSRPAAPGEWDGTLASGD